MERLDAVRGGVSQGSSCGSLEVDAVQAVVARRGQGAGRGPYATSAGCGRDVTGREGHVTQDEGDREGQVTHPWDEGD